MSSSLSAQAIHLEEYQEKLDVFKTQGRTLISDKFAQIYNRKLNRLEDCESLKDLLHKKAKPFDEELADIKANIEQALYSLESSEKSYRDS